MSAAPSVAASEHPTTARPRVTFRLCAAAFALVGVTATAVTLFVPFNWVAGEGGVLETAQLTLWGLAGVAALVACPTRPTARDRWNVLWLGVVALGVLWRELDGHIWLNPEHLGSWGIRYRLDWWTDGSVPVAVKALWVGAGLLGAALLIVPQVFARPDGLAQLRRGDPGAWMFLVALGGVGFGWVADDLLGRGLLVPVWLSKIFEESGELTGATAYALCVAASVLTPLALREGRSARPA